MLVLLAGIFVVHIATVIMLFVSTISNVWVVGLNSSIFFNGSAGLWKNCSDGNCGDLLYGHEGALKSSQAFMILSIIFSVVALMVFIFQLFTMEKGNRFFLSGASMLVCSTQTLCRCESPDISNLSTQPLSLALGSSLFHCQAVYFDWSIHLH
nr:epithelial membrane protein 1 isoform X2 [Cavia porcellus]